jgi:hypothetical protein
MSFLFLSFAKLENRRAEKVLPRGFDISGKGVGVGKEFKGVNMVQILCPHECKWKKYSC